MAPGIICGLHELRSQALFIYAHDDIVFQKEESIKTALQCMTYDTLTIALGQAIQEFKADLVIDGLVIRLSEKDNLQEWIAVLTGLGIATLQNISKKWIRILENVELEPAHWPMATVMACSEGAEMPGNDEIDAFDKINVAVKEFRTIEVKDLRETLLGKATLLNGMQNVSDIEDLTALFSSLAPITGVGSVAIDDVSISGKVEGSFEQLCNVLDNARAIDINLARNIVEKFGGTEHLLEQFYINTPWITMPKLEHGEHNEKIVLSDLVFHNR